MKTLLYLLLMAFVTTAFAQTNNGLVTPATIKKTAPYKPTLKLSGFIDVPGMTESSFNQQANKLNLGKTTKTFTPTGTDGLLTWAGEWAYHCTLPIGCSVMSGVIKFELTLMPGKENYYYEFGSFQHLAKDAVVNPLSFKTITTDSLVPYHGPTTETAKWEQLAWEDLNEDIKKHVAATLNEVKNQMAAAGK